MGNFQRSFIGLYRITKQAVDTWELLTVYHIVCIQGWDQARDNLTVFFNSTNLTIIRLMGWDMCKSGFELEALLSYLWTLVKCLKCSLWLQISLPSPILNGPSKLVALGLYASPRLELSRGSGHLWRKSRGFRLAQTCSWFLLLQTTSQRWDHIVKENELLKHSWDLFPNHLLKELCQSVLPPRV